MREEKLGPPRWIRGILIPLLIVAVIVLVILLVREKRRDASLGYDQTTTGATLASR